MFNLHSIFLGNYLPNVVTIPTHKRENPSHTDKILVCDIGVQLCVCKYQDTGTFKNRSLSKKLWSTGSLSTVI